MADELVLADQSQVYFAPTTLLGSTVHLSGTISTTLGFDQLPADVQRMAEEIEGESQPAAYYDLGSQAKRTLERALADAVEIQETGETTIEELIEVGGIASPGSEIVSGVQITDIDSEGHADNSDALCSVTGDWEGDVQVLHPYSWSVSDVIERARTAVTNGETTDCEYTESSLVRDYLPVNWVEIDPPEDNRHSEILAAYMHTSLLYTVSIGKFSSDDGDQTLYTLFELAAPTPSGQPGVTVTAYGASVYAQRDATALMESINGAVAAEESDPIDAAHSAVQLRGEAVDMEHVRVERPRFLDSPSVRDSIPARPLTEPDFEEVKSALMGSFTNPEVLVPDVAQTPDAVTQDAVESRTTADGEDLVTAFTVVDEDGSISVFELFEGEEGLGWYARSGSLNLFTPGDSEVRRG